MKLRVGMERKHRSHARHSRNNYLATVHPHSMSISLEGTNKPLAKVIGSPKCKFFVCGTCVSKKKFCR